MPNLYKSQGMKKYIRNEKDKLYERTGIEKNSRILITGRSGGGKTNALMEIIKESDGFFDHIFLIYKTEEPFYKFLQDSMIDTKNPELSSLSVYKNLDEFPYIEQFSDAEDMKKGKKEHYLIVFDDCVNEFSDKKYFLKFEKYFKYGRKKNLTIIFLTQSYFDTEIFFRKQMNYVILTRISSINDLKSIIREYSSLLTVDELLNIYNKMHKEYDGDLPFLLINLNAKNENNYISINLNNWLKFEEKEDENY